MVPSMACSLLNAQRKGTAVEMDGAELKVFGGYVQ